jgi:hypothetical protein
MSDESVGKDESGGKKVGYKKPPQHTRFKKGQCPNPRGRPKGALNLKTEVKSMLEAPVTVNVRGKPKKMTTLKASLWRVREGALKGNPRFLKMLLEHADRFQVDQATDPPSDISRNEQAILDAYREEILAEAARDKSPNPDDEDIK